MLWYHTASAITITTMVLLLIVWLLVRKNVISRMWWGGGASSSSSRVPVLFMNCNYAPGPGTKVTKGDENRRMSVSTLGTNASVRSMLIPKGFEVTLYNRKNGQKQTFNDNVKCLDLDNGWTDFEVAFKSVVAIAEETSFQGRTAALTTGQYATMDKFGINISSIEVPLGYKVTLYDNANFKGASLTMENKREIDLRKIVRMSGKNRSNWNDAIKSIIVERTTMI